MSKSTKVGRSGAVRSRKVRLAAAFAAPLLLAAPAARAAIATWNLPGGGTWNLADNWNPPTIPNAVGDGAIFTNSNQTANRSVTLDGPQTVGSLVFNNDAANAFTNSIATGTGGPVTFDEVDAGPAVINVPAAIGTGNNTISVAMVLNDNLVANVDNTTASSAAGALNLTGAMSGPGGFTKNGDGIATFGTAAKTYTGPTVINGGRTRISVAAHPTGNSSFTINAGGQVEFIAAAGTFSFGGNTVNLNGSGPTSGPFAQFPGAIRPVRAGTYTISAPVNLQSDTLLHMQATAGVGAGATPSNGNITIQGVISGPGKLTFTAPNSDADQGYLIVSRNNTYTGGTLVAGGTLLVTGAQAKLGAGNVTVDNASSPASIARLSLALDTADAIDDAATLILAGGGNPGVADQNYAVLGDAINETVAGLVLGGVPQTTPGTYGSTLSGAMFQNDEYFSGTGVLTVLVPEPATLSLLALATTLCTRRSRREVVR